MNRNVVSIRSDQTVHEAIEIMKKHDIHQLPVVENKSLKGMLQIKKILMMGFDEKTKINSIITNAPTIVAEEDVGKAAGIFLEVGLRALPVEENGKIAGIVSEVDFLNALDTKIDITQYVSPCIIADIDESVGKIKSIMNDNHISRVPLMNEDGKIEGIVDILDIADIYSTPQKYETTGKKIRGTIKMNEDDVLARNVMRPAVILKKDTDPAEIIKAMKKAEEVIIENGDYSILTPKDLLELLVSEPKKGIFVQIVGLKTENSTVVAKLDQSVNEFVNKIGKLAPRPEFLFVHVDHHYKEGKKIKYSIRTRFKNSYGLFVAKAWGYNPMEAIQESINKLEGEVIKKHGKVKQTWKKSGQRRKELEE